MRRLICLGVFLLALGPVFAQGVGGTPYRIDFDGQRDVVMEDKVAKGGAQNRIFISVRFSISVDGTANDPPGTVYKVIIEENGKPVKILDVPQPAASDDLAAVLAIDTSGSMRGFNRMDQARLAADTFLGKIPAKAECGLVLFDHENRPPLIQPTTNRQLLRDEIARVQPRGGTAYLDAAYQGIEMLAKVPANREKALVIMTDGLDLNSKKSLEGVIALARQHRVRVYTIGIGEPGKLETVSTALALDHSGSMAPPADDKDKTSKIKALHEAATRFVSIMPSTGRASLIPFSSTVSTPRSFAKGDDKFLLMTEIKKLEPNGETALFDAIYTGVATLEADNSKGRRVVVAMTDGIDNASRRRVEEVIERAKEAKIPLYLLGFGRQEELDDATMKHMAESTGGKYYHAKNSESLIEIFENLSIAIHDDGIDEATLTRLAEKTGGKYYPAKDVGQLQLILEKVTQSIQRKNYEESFESLHQVRDGAARKISIKLVRGDGNLASNVVGEDILGGFKVVGRQEGAYQVSGVVVAEMNHLIFLLFLLALGALIALPAWMKRPAKA